MRHILEGIVTPSAESVPGGVRLRMVEVQQVEHHLEPGEDPPEGWTTLEDGLAARGREHVLTGVIEVALPIQSILVFMRELTEAVNTTLNNEPKLAAEVGGFLGAGPNGLVVPDIVLPPGIDLRRRD